MFRATIDVRVRLGLNSVLMKHLVASFNCVQILKCKLSIERSLQFLLIGSCSYWHSSGRSKCRIRVRIRIRARIGIK